MAPPADKSTENDIVVTKLVAEFENFGVVLDDLGIIDNCKCDTNKTLFDYQSATYSLHYRNITVISSLELDNFWSQTIKTSTVVVT